MSLHLMKLAVGAETIPDMAEWLASGRANWPRNAPGAKHVAHLTRNMPKRAGEIVGKGSLYWIIKGRLAVRQKIVAIEETMKDGKPGCAIVLDRKLVITRPRPQRPFQGWRYLVPSDAPADIGPYGAKSNGSKAIEAELMELGLL